MSTTISRDPQELKVRWETLRTEQPNLYMRNAAAELGVSEAELLATRVGDGVVFLNTDFKAILLDVCTLGYVMALTRNNDVVHERKGPYINPQLDGHVGLFLGADIDLRIFWGSWAYAFAVEETGKDMVRKSIQFFGKDGNAIHKIYLTEQSNVASYNELVAKHQAADQAQAVTVQPARAARPEQPDSAIDVAGFQAGWLALKDTHDFHMLVHGMGLTRTQALRMAPVGNWSVSVSPSALRATLTKAAADKVPIMIFVGNPGMIQIHSGEVVNVVDARGWLNVLDPELNVHIREEAITQAWIVRKPTTDGLVTALECYDAKGEQLIQLFGKRKPGIPELESWRELVQNVEEGCKA